MTSTPNLTIKDFGGEPTIFLRRPVPEDEKWTALNPTIAQDDQGRYAVLIRSCNFLVDEKNQLTVTEGKGVKNRTWFAYIDPISLELTPLRRITYTVPDDLAFHRESEDPRLYWREDGWYFIAALWEPPTIKYTKLAVFKFDAEAAHATFVEVLKSPKEDRLEKNWMPPNVPTDKFDFVYSPTQIYKDGKVIGPETNMSSAPLGQVVDAVSAIRGGSQLVLQPDGTYLAVVHDLQDRTYKRINPASFREQFFYSRYYRHYFARYNAKGILTHLSDPWIFKRPGIEFAAGLAEHGDDLLVTFGAIDMYSGLSRVPKKKVVESLHKIGG